LFLSTHPDGAFFPSRRDHDPGRTGREECLAQQTPQPATILSIAFSIWLLTIMRAGAIVENALAKQHGWKPGDRIVIQGKFFPVNLELNIRGIYKPAVPARGIWFN